MSLAGINEQCFPFLPDVFPVCYFSTSDFPAAYCLARGYGHLEDPRQARVQGVRRYQTFGLRFLIDALDIVHDDMYYYNFMMGLARWSVTAL